jgi:hypothetical protein
MATHAAATAAGLSAIVEASCESTAGASSTAPDTSATAEETESSSWGCYGTGSPLGETYKTPQDILTAKQTSPDSGATAVTASSTSSDKWDPRLARWYAGQFTKSGIPPGRKAFRDISKMAAYRTLAAAYAGSHAWRDAVLAWMNAWRVGDDHVPAWLPEAIKALTAR